MLSSITNMTTLHSIMLYKLVLQFVLYSHLSFSFVCVCVCNFTETVMGLMNVSAFPGQSASWECQVQSTIPLQFTWYLDNVLVINTTGSHMDVTASSSYILTNVSYSDDNSNVTCSAAGSLVVNSAAVYLTGKSVRLTFGP